MIANVWRSLAFRQSNFTKLRYFTTIADTEYILAEEYGDKGVLVYNRPQALNCKNLEMQHKLESHLNKWKNTMSLIMIKTNCKKAFCVGGDLKSFLYGTFEDNKQIFKIEYTTNHIIGSLKIPYVALIDGITIGGGVGSSVHGRYRIATEKTVFAMPEAAIGLIPDSGCLYVLPRLQGKLGFYLALTGTRLKGQDVLHAGIATHYCDSSKIKQIEQTILDLKNPNDVEGLLNDFCPKPMSDFSLSKHLDQINRSFDASSVEEILSNLEKDNSEWAKTTIKTLRSMSPTSLKMTLRTYNLGLNLSLGECLQLEYRINSLCEHYVCDTNLLNFYCSPIYVIIRLTYVNETRP